MDKEFSLLDVEDLDEELIEITPATNYELSDAQDLPETAASSCGASSCSIIIA